MPLLVVVTRARCSPAVLFDLALDVDAHAESLPRSRETATTRGARVLGPGDEVTFTARHLGVRWRLSSRITEHERPHRFVDEQVRGPFASMRHEHLFEADGDGGTVMTDRMHVVAPLGPVGALAGRTVLWPHLRRLLRERGAHLATVAAARGQDL
ncbi:SRPBCC family protein [Aquipuribacter hungaricus]|uniref:SRPBCC family protein n=1 Tax=Aquipuribacter hungaricus TaxID=545624 RepID=A0ABV7WEM3_9MICO